MIFDSSFRNQLRKWQCTSSCSLLGQYQRMTKKELSKSTSVRIQMVWQLIYPPSTQIRAAQAAQTSLSVDSEAQDARRRSFMFWFAMQQTPLPGGRTSCSSVSFKSQYAGRRRVPPALSAGKLEVEPLLVCLEPMPWFGRRGLQPHCGHCRDET